MKPQIFRIAQADVDLFASLVGDLDPMHNDPAAKLLQDWAGPVLIGSQLVALLPRLLCDSGVVPDDAQRGWRLTRIPRIRFVSAVPVNAEIGHHVDVHSRPGDELACSHVFAPVAGGRPYAVVESELTVIA